MNEYVVGLDIGFGNLKIVHGNSAHEPENVVAPTGAAPATNLPPSIFGHESTAVRVKVNGTDYVACIPHEQLANHNRVLYEDYCDTEAYRALFYASLLATGQRHVDLVVTGLPSDQAKDVARQNRIRNLMSGRHVVNRDGDVISVSEVAVVPQPLGGYVDYIASHGMADELREAKTLVVDPGYFSVDWVLLANDAIQQDAMGSSKFATSKLLEEASERIFKDKGGRVSADSIEHALRRGRETIMLHGDALAYKPYIAEAGEHLMPAVMTDILNSLRTRRDSVDVVLLCGGGAVFYEGAIRAAFPHCRINVAPASVTANARGFWHLGSD